MTDKPVKSTNCYAFPRQSFILTNEDWQHILDRIAEGYSMTGAARSVGASRQAIYDRIERDPDFGKAVRDRVEQGTDTMEDWMLEKARSPQGFLANIASLKARRPQKWGDRQGAALAPVINITINAPSPQKLRQIIDAEYKLLPEASEDGGYSYDHDAGDLTQ